MQLQLQVLILGIIGKKKYERSLKKYNNLAMQLGLSFEVCNFTSTLPSSSLMLFQSEYFITNQCPFSCDKSKNPLLQTRKQQKMKK